MKQALVTGSAGFIGSHLAERLLDDGYSVIGIDCFTDYYDVRQKESNLLQCQKHHAFQFLRADILDLDLGPLLSDVDTVYHLAAQPGVRGSWGSDFQIYIDRNIAATQHLLEAVRNNPVRKLVMASSSSVYGNAERYPTNEGDVPEPVSPYGVSKLATERLGLAYYHSYGIPVVALRYFTVYGPRQRPDMAFHKFLRAIYSYQSIPLYGDGLQTRDFTFVSDAVDATVRAGESSVAGRVYNVGGGNRVTVLDVLNLLEKITGIRPRIEHLQPVAGDVRDTGSDLTLIRRELGYAPSVDLASGLRAESDWWREAHLPVMSQLNSVS